MRRTPVAIATLGLAASLLVGCAPASSPACERAPQSASIEDLVSVEGQWGVAPAVSTSTPFSTEHLRFADIDAGDGTALVSDDQLFVMGLTILDGETGELLVAQGYEGDLSRVNDLGTWVETVPGFDAVLRCATEGSRIVAGLTADDLGPAAAQIGVPSEADAVAVIDLLKVYLPAANGAAQLPTERGMPTVVLAPSGQPGVTIPDIDPPTELRTQVLKRGDGAPIAADDAVRAAFTGLTWAEREVFQSSWGGPAPALVPAQLVPGLTEALVGQTVGSQVLVVVPPELGYGDEAQGSIPAGSTLVFVFDILGVDGPADG